MSLASQIAIRPVGEDRFASVLPPTRMGDLASWAYGGNVLAIAISTAYATVSPTHHLHSITGTFVRAANTNSPLICTVERIRSTRAFETRLLRVSQTIKETEQLCLLATADFHIQEPAEMVNYSVRPSTAATSTTADAAVSVPEDGLYRYIDPFMETRPLVTATAEDPTEKISAERVRLLGVPRNEGAQLAALSFYMDRGLAYIPANHSGYSLLQASACATLDFALRLATHRVDVGEWHVMEQRTCVAANARALSEGKMFDGEGRLVAVMSQQTILRPGRGVGSKI